jgi:hypothetical protein
MEDLMKKMMATVLKDMSDIKDAATAAAVGAANSAAAKSEEKFQEEIRNLQDQLNVVQTASAKRPDVSGIMLMRRLLRTLVCSNVLMLSSSLVGHVFFPEDNINLCSHSTLQLCGYLC